MLKRILLLAISLFIFGLPAWAAQIGGNPQGTVILTEFFDYQCPHCRGMENTIDGLIKKNPNLKVVYRVLPILGDDSWFDARASLAAQYQNKFNNFHQILMYQGQSLSEQEVMSLAQQIGLNKEQLLSDMRKPAIDDQIKQNFSQAKTLQIAGVPTFFVGLANQASRFRFDGEVSYAQLENAIVQTGK